jgi:hypothetical protein
MVTAIASEWVTAINSESVTAFIASAVKGCLAFLILAAKPPQFVFKVGMTHCICSGIVVR